MIGDWEFDLPVTSNQLPALRADPSSAEDDVVVVEDSSLSGRDGAFGSGEADVDASVGDGQDGAARAFMLRADFDGAFVRSF